MRNTDRLDNLPTRAPMRPRKSSWLRAPAREDRAARREAQAVRNG